MTRRTRAIVRTLNRIRRQRLERGRKIPREVTRAMKQRQRTAEEQRDVARMMLDKADEIQAFELRASLDTAVRDMVATATMKLVEQACLMAADADFMEGLIDVEEIYSTAAWNAAAILDPDFNLRWMDQNLRKHLGIGWPSNWSPWERFPKRRAA